MTSPVAPAYRNWRRKPRVVAHLWEKLSAVPEAEQCGWLKDRYGLSWPIVPAGLDRMMQDGDAGKAARVTRAF